MRTLATSLLILAVVPGSFLAGNAAYAAVTEATPNGIAVSHAFDTTASPAKAYDALVHPGRWWNPQHTYSGKSENLSITPTAGGCFCERWATGSVQHAQVIYAERNSALRLSGAFGPLQEFALVGTLTVVIKADGAGSKLVATYRVSGDFGKSLEPMAPLVDGMLTEQWTRLKRLIETGKPIAP